MRTINSRNQFYLHWAKIIACFAVFFVTQFRASAQVEKHYNLLSYDDKFLHYGFTLASNYSVYRVKHSEAFVNQDEISSVRSIDSYSFALGFILNMRLGEFFDLRLLPTVAFYERRVKFRFNDVDAFSKKYRIRELSDPSIAVFESSFVEFPLLLKYKAQRRGNHRMYMVGGLKPGIRVGGGKKKTNDQLLTKNFDLSLEAGFGLDIYYPLFKFSPELRFSLGLKNLYEKNNNVLAESIDELSSYTVTLYFLFE